MNDALFPIFRSISRRSFLQLGSIAAGGLAFSDLSQQRAGAATASAKPDTSVILVWLPGGPPHTETYDLKPDAPSDYRGEFQSIHTNVPGIDICELLPRQAKIADRFSIIRSIAHGHADHGGGHKRFMTGRIPKTPVGTVNDAPSVGAIIAKMREPYRIGIPQSIVCQTSDDVHAIAQSAAYLGPKYNPLCVGGDPISAGFKLKDADTWEEAQRERLRYRHALLKSIDTFPRNTDPSGTMTAMDHFDQMAMDLLTSPVTRDAFDLTKVDSKIRERYGMHAYGQRALAARRLVEAGCSFVLCSFDCPDFYTKADKIKQGGVDDWDSHSVNGHIFFDLRYRLPYVDQALTTLIEDIYERGLDKKVMIVVAGEFGRTPRLEYQVGNRTGVMQPGRDHWPGAQSVVVSGGGLRMGQIVGSTDRLGEHPKDRPLTPNDLWATVYRHLGIDYNQSLFDEIGRPMPILPFGEPIRELI